MGRRCDDAVLPISVADSRPGRAIKVGVFPDAIAITPNGKVAYVGNDGSGTVTPVSTADSKAGRAIKVGISPGIIAVTPDGRTVYVGSGPIEQRPSLL